MMVATLAAAPVPASAESVPPAGGAGLVRWLEGGHHRGWEAATSLRPSAGPHFGAVRVFLNGPLRRSLKAGQPAHPPGAAAVKELYGQGQTVRGWAVMVKVDMPGTPEGTWHWFELFDGEVITDAPGASLCQGCHLSGHDMVITRWKPR